MTSGLRVTAAARRDISGIVRFTRQTWGAAQAAKYVGEIDQRMRWLAENPRRGRPRPEIAPGLFAYPQGTHLVFFVMDGEGIAVVGVPHQSMDLHAHFEGADLE